MPKGSEPIYCPHCGEVVEGILESGASLANSEARLDQDDASPAQKFGNEKSGNAEDASDCKLADAETVAVQLRVIFIMWIVLVALVVTIVIQFNRVKDEPEVPIITAAETENSGASDRQADVYALPKCVDAITGFLKASTASAKAQYVYNGVSLSREMEAYYASQANFHPELLGVRIVKRSELRIPGVDAVGAICQTEGGERFEVVFIRDGNEWKIEWKSFVRYSEADWSLFKSQKNGAEADFRLYMRVMDVGEDLAGNDIMLKFYEPDVFRGREFDGYASDSVRVSAYGSQGQLITKITNDKHSKAEDLVGMKIADFDPENFHRVRVRMRVRKVSGEDPALELVELLADHWYDPAIVRDTGLSGGSE
ncbi:MAG: hypothetical protein ACPIG6_05835 [Akkermansiaceae bacterium]